MTVATLPIIIEDPQFVEERGLNPRDAVEEVTTEDEQFFLDGPVAARAAVVDRNPFTGRHENPVQWLAADSRFDVRSRRRYSREAIAVSVFGTVLKTLALFERPDVLGHEVRWQFDSKQLLLVPRAGIWANALYDRYSQSVQFFCFHDKGGRRRGAQPHTRAPGRDLVYTALSRDIVAHETGHAIVDALLPALYDAVSPQSLALHEALADLTAVAMALDSPRVREWLAHRDAGHLRGTRGARLFVAELASRFGWPQRRSRPLRNAENDKKLVAGDEPHAMSEVLTGAVWRAIVALHERRLARQARSGVSLDEILSASAREITRVLFRALHFLPPAEATFADYARAVIQSTVRADEGVDQRVFLDVLVRQLRRRGALAMNATVDVLLADMAREKPRSLAVDLDGLVRSEWVAYTFAEAHRRVLKIPKGAPLRVLPRHDVRRRYHRDGADPVEEREVVFQVTWEEEEHNPAARGLARKRAVFHGTSVVFAGTPDGSGKFPVISLLSTDKDKRLARDRSAVMLALHDQGRLQLNETQDAPSWRPLRPVVTGHLTDDMVRLRGTARLLHLANYGGRR